MTTTLDEQLTSVVDKNDDADSTATISQTRLIWRRFKRHRIALFGLCVLIFFYMVAIFAGFFAPYNADTRFRGMQNAPPVVIQFTDENGQLTTPYFYERNRERDPQTFAPVFTDDLEARHPVLLMVRGDKYKLLGIFETDIHLFGTDDPDVPLNLFGTDDVSRDLFARVIHGAQVSLFIGFGGVFISFLLGCVIGGISGYLGGRVDEIIQRIIDLLISIPTLPLWMALTAAIPRDWSVTQTYFALTLVLSAVGWMGLARVVRGKLLSMRDLDFVTASKLAGGSDFYVVIRHLLPNFASHLIVTITLAIPGMILGETALSFIGLGMQDPGVSWGVLLQETLNFTAIAQQPWKLIPAVFVIITILMFNYMGDGVRDAADPYSL
jgi:peptide/nickel transport system permease protein